MVRKLHFSGSYPLTDIGIGGDAGSEAMLAHLVDPSQIPKFYMDDKVYCPLEFGVRSEVSLYDAKKQLEDMVSLAHMMVSDTTREPAQVVFFSRGSFESRSLHADSHDSLKITGSIHWVWVALAVVIGDEVYMTQNGHDFFFADRKKEEDSVPTQFVAHLLALVGKYFVPRSSVREPRAYLCRIKESPGVEPTVCD